MLAIGKDGRATASDVDRFATGILRSGDEILRSAGDIVGLAAPNGPAFLAALIALARADRTVVLLDPLAPSRDRSRALAAVGATAVLAFDAAWPASPDDARWSLTTPAGLLPETNAAVIKLTSGSGGVPRGVAVSCDALLADESALASTMSLTGEDRLLAMIPMSHSYGFTTLALSSLVRGLTLILPGDHGPLAPLSAAREFEATMVPTVPAYLQAVLRLSNPPPWPGTLRRVITAGALLSPSTAQHFREQYGRPVHVFYGSSECGGICYDREGGAAERSTVGTPVDGVDVSLASIEDAPGEGLVTVTSAAVAAAYVPEPDRRLADGRFETADVAVWNGAELSLKRRADRVLNVRGHKVDPAEVERILAGLDGVEDVAVTSAGPAVGADDVVSAVLASRSGQLTYAAVAAWCQSHLADHKIPRRIIVVDALPRTTRGKVDRAAVLAIAQRDRPGGGQAG